MAVVLPRKFVKSNGMVFLMPSADTVYDNAGAPLSDVVEGSPEDTTPETLVDSLETQRAQMEEVEQAEEEARQYAAEHPDEVDEDLEDAVIEDEASRVAAKDGTSTSEAKEKLKAKADDDKKLAQDRKVATAAGKPTPAKAVAGHKPAAPVKQTEEDKKAVEEEKANAQSAEDKKAEAHDKQAGSK